MKKVLIVSYYWPPSGGSGVQRWLKFVKYLPDYGIKPYVYTPENPDFDIKDESLLNDIPKEAIIIKKKIIEPYWIYKKISRKKNVNVGITKKEKRSLFQRMIFWIRNNFFIPDPRILWVKPSIRFLKKYIQENKIKTIVTTGPPHSMHLIGLGLKKELGKSIVWIADFRDPWTQIYTKEQLAITDKVLKKWSKLEQEVLAHCDKLVTVGEQLRIAFESMGAKGKAHTIWNGYDDSDYDKIELEYKAKDKFVLSYIGFLPNQSNPIFLWKAIHNILKEKKEFRDKFILKFIGHIDDEVKESIKNNGLINYCEFVGMVSHKEALRQQKSANLLLLLIPNVSTAKSIVTGKIFEYIKSTTPIISIGPKDSDVEMILKETNSGVLFDYEDSTGMGLYLNTKLKLFEKKGSNKVSLQNYKKYSRKELTRKLSEIIFA